MEGPATETLLCRRTEGRKRLLGTDSSQGVDSWPLLSSVDVQKIKRLLKKRLFVRSTSTRNFERLLLIYFTQKTVHIRLTNPWRSVDPNDAAGGALAGHRTCRRTPQRQICRNCFNDSDAFHVCIWPNTRKRSSRGFAFVTFVSKDDAARAMDALQGFGCDHLILKLEWAKPNTPKDPGASGTEFRSGYGKALAQDTKEKVSFASNLTK